MWSILLMVVSLASPPAASKAAPSSQPVEKAEKKGPPASQPAETPQPSSQPSSAQSVESEPEDMADEDTPPMTSTVRKRSRVGRMPRPSEMPLKILGVGRAVDLGDRTIKTPPELYLGPTKYAEGTEDFIQSIELGSRLIVYRREGIPPFGNTPDKKSGMEHMLVKVGEAEVMEIRRVVIVARLVETTDDPALTIPSALVNDFAQVKRRPAPPPPPPKRMVKRPKRKKMKSKPEPAAPAPKYTRPNPRYTL
ncbi:MAG: hypothetical protein ACE366_25675 [Bradymonadia bacterium]